MTTNKSIIGDARLVWTSNLDPIARRYEPGKPITISPSEAFLVHILVGVVLSESTEDPGEQEFQSSRVQQAEGPTIGLR